MAARVPTVNQVKPGAAVSIILKQDQRSGRQVQGLVQDLLTRGNHPRGIKVRLQDGRIGRVQRMVTGDVPRPPDAASLQQDLQDQQVARGGGDGDGGRAGGRAFGGGGGGGRPRNPGYLSERLGLRYTDVRNEDGNGGEEPSTESDLMAYVKEARTKKKGRGKKNFSEQLRTREGLEPEPEPELEPGSDSVGSNAFGGESSSGRTDVVSCPVCNDFEGDEAAVAHHVERHFS